MPSLLRLLAGAAVGWTAVGLLASLFLAGRLSTAAGPATWAEVIGPTLLYVALWIVATPVLLRATSALTPTDAPRRAAAVGRLLLLGTLVPAVALAHLVAYAALASRWADAATVTNLPEPALFYVGRFRENVVIGALLLAGQLALDRRRRLRERELAAARLAAQLAESRLQALGMELRPHFLFNTLNAISGMVWADPAKADAMVVQLGELLRRTLESSDAPTSSLAEERHVLELYLAIQQVRFGSRLTLRVDVPDALGAAEVPRFLLQPLVENAFQHGLGPKRGPVTLVVSAAREGERLVLRVSDDGVGLPADGAIVESTGVGNPRRRLHALYGEAASLALMPHDGGGTVVTVTLPYRPYASAAPADAALATSA